MMPLGHSIRGSLYWMRLIGEELQGLVQAIQLAETGG
jgi:hypothetical protein